MVIRLKVPIEMHYTVIPMGTSKVNSSRFFTFRSGILNSDRRDGLVRKQIRLIRYPAVHQQHENSNDKQCNKAAFTTR